MESKQVHCGQYKSYGDFFRVWEITTDETEGDKVLQYCRENLYERELPKKAEFKQNIRYGNKEFGNANYYFAGYYELEKINTGWKFTVCEPFTD